MALSAAGIEADVSSPRVALDPAIEAVLAWAVREGATNVIRHSGAQHCSVRLRAGPGSAAVEVVDDGAGDSSAGDAGRNGILATVCWAGRAGRAAPRPDRGGALSDGGFRLAVIVPVRAQ